MSINGEQDKIIKEFSALNDWFEKYEHLMELGKQHSSISKKFKTDQYALPGCNSKVWIVSKNHNGRVLFWADSESIIIRGILSLILRVVNNRLPDDITTAELYFLREIGLSTALSPVRANGVRAIVEYVKSAGIK